MPGRATFSGSLLRRLAIAGLFGLAATFAALTVVGAAIEAASPAFAQKKKPPKPRISPQKVPPGAAGDDTTGATVGVAKAKDSGTIKAGTVPAGDAPSGPAAAAIDDPAFEEGEAAMETIDGSVEPAGDADPADPLVALPDQPLDLSLPGSGDQPLDLGGAAAGQPIDLQPQPTPPVAGNPASVGSIALEAKLTEASPPIMTGLSWRVFGSEPGPDGKLKLAGEAHGGSVTMQLRPGTYFIHASYGRAGATQQITVSEGMALGTIVLNAGGIRLSALVGKDRALSVGDVAFDIYAPDDSGSDERILLVSNAPPAKVIGLNAGIYHVICRYGAANAIVRADIKVEPGKLTEATVYQKAARLTLKLVSAHGGEALANTAWSVVTPSGETVTDSVGAFPSVVLAVGEYTAIAKHDGKIFERNFVVEAGLDRDVEVIAE